MSSTFDWDAYIASLPTPGVDEMPPPVELSPEQLALCAQKVMQLAYNGEDDIGTYIESSKVGRANDELHALRLRLSKLEGVQMKLRRALRNEVITSAALMEAIQDVLNV